jgi:hypothetical protein
VITFKNPSDSESTLQVFKDICETLNENNREQCLLSCLSIPSDKVKKAVAMCLDSIPLTELDTSEIHNIMDCFVAHIEIAHSSEILTRILLLMAKILVCPYDCKKELQNSMQNTLSQLVCEKV